MDKKQCFEKANEILLKMSLKEKIGQVTQMYYSGDNFDEICEVIKEINPGSLILAGSAFAGNEEQNSVKREKIDILQDLAVNETANGIPILFGRDVIHGHSVVFPNPLNMACSFDYDLVRECYDAIRAEAINTGIKWTFAPMIDLARDPRWGRIVEGTGEDPYIGECYAKAAVKGFQTDDISNENAMAACAKHFVGYGASEGGRDYNHTEISDYLMQNVYLSSFRGAVEADVATVMSSFNDLNGVPMSGNKKMLTDVLRGQLGFEGFVVSDWDAIRQMMAFSFFAESKKHAAELAINAGIDLDMADNCYLESLEELINENKVSVDTLDEAVKRIIYIKLRLGLFDHPKTKIEQYSFDKHLALSKKMAVNSIVLLKNDNNVLPLSKKSKIGLAGPYLHNKSEWIGSWALDPDYSLLSTPYEAIKKVAPDAEICVNPDNCNEEILYLRECDCIVLFLGENRRMTGEANSVSNPTISSMQLELVKRAKLSGKPIIGVLGYARPVALGEAKDLFDAILYVGHCGSCTSDAVADILFGESEPSGRLCFTLPFSIGQIPIYYNMLPGARQISGYYKDENPFHRNYQDSVGFPAFPFGYGLGYTEFSYSDFRIDKTEMLLDKCKEGGEFTVEFTVKNIGNRKGKVVAQLYIHDLLATRLRPLRVLRGFLKQELDAKEEKTFKFNIGYKDLGFYLEDGSFIAETGDFEIYIGENCYAEKKFNISLI